MRLEGLPNLMDFQRYLGMKLGTFRDSLDLTRKIRKRQMKRAWVLWLSLNLTLQPGRAFEFQGGE